jgi:hypothetical protein
MLQYLFTYFSWGEHTLNSTTTSNDFADRGVNSSIIAATGASLWSAEDRLPRRWIKIVPPRWALSLWRTRCGHDVMMRIIWSTQIVLRYNFFQTHECDWWVARRTRHGTRAIMPCSFSKRMSVIGDRDSALSIRMDFWFGKNGHKHIHDSAGCWM